jgi:protoporphyrinogen oxidase
MNKERVIVLGAGITGLVAAYYLSKKFEVVLVEKQKEIGGMSTSFKHNDFILDYGPHKIYTQIRGIIEEIEKVVLLLKVKKRNSIYLKGNYFDFPLKMQQIATKMPMTAFSGFLDIVKNKLGKKTGSYLEKRFGKTLYNMVFASYAEKIWDNPKKLDAELARRRVAVSSIFELIKSIITGKTGKFSADFFYYPEKGILELIENLKKRIIENGGRIMTNFEIDKIEIKDNKISKILMKGKKLDADYVISTIPLNSIIKKINAPDYVAEAGNNLKYKDTNIIYFILNKERAIKENWIFFPEKKFLFNRISEQKSFSSYTSPKDKTALMVETTKTVNGETLDKIKEQLIKLKIIKENEIEEVFFKTLKNAYPLYYRGYRRNINIILSYLDKIENLITIGRQGLFNYNNMDQCWDMGRKAAEHIIKKRNKLDWEKTREYFNSYRIVD